MEYKNIRISLSCYQKIDRSYKKFGYTSKMYFIESMIDFFIENSISPNASLNLNLDRSIDKMNQDFIQRDNSFRKWFGHLSNKKIATIIKQQEDIIQQNDFISKFILDLKSNEIAEKIMEDVEIKNSEVDKVDHDFIEKSKTIIQQKDQIISEYKNKFEIILSRAKEEKTTFGKNKIVIEFSPLEFENFKDLV